MITTLDTFQVEFFYFSEYLTKNEPSRMVIVVVSEETRITWQRQANCFILAGMIIANLPLHKQKSITKF
jgi:hypothetical protein